MTGSGDVLAVALGDRSYDILIGSGLVSAGGLGAARIAEIAGPRPAWIVTDETVAGLHLARVRAALAAAGARTEAIVLPAGESAKSFGTARRVVETVLDGAPERGSVVVALGGGVVGDVAGFAASMILRGVGLVQVPTTLLAQVDSSVGGKTGINTRHGKNLVGAFHQPRLVVADADLLETLPRRERLAGYAEVVKYGLIGDPALFEWLRADGAAVVDGEVGAWRRAVRASCAAKAEIVARDEREGGERALLNFGHTFGHALEAETGYGPGLLHGEAVAVGMILALELSAALGLCPRAEADRVRDHFRQVGLPADLPPEAARRGGPEALVRRMRRDKKVRDGRVSFVLARGIGRAFVAPGVDLEVVADVLRRTARAAASPAGGAG